METRKSHDDAVIQDVKLEQGREGFASGMERRSNDAAIQDVPITSLTLVCAGNMERRSYYADMKDVQVKPGPRRGECASGTRKISNGVAMKDVQVISSTMVYAKDMGQRSRAGSNEVTSAIRRLI